VTRRFVESRGIVRSYRLREWGLSLGGFAMMAVAGLAQIAFVGGILLLLYRCASWLVTGTFGFRGVGEWLHAAGIAWDFESSGWRLLAWIRHFPLSLFLILVSVALAVLAIGILAFLLNRRDGKNR